MQNITEFLEENKDTIFRYLTFNKFGIWTPKQMTEKYCDESVYLDTHYEFAKITNAIDTPNGLMLEFDIVDDCDFEPYGHKEYKLLNDISLEVFKCDNDEMYRELDELLHCN